MKTALSKSLLFLLVIVGVVSTSFVFVILHHDDGDNRVNYSLITHDNQRVTQKDFSGSYQLVFFGFTSCHMVCPTQMGKLTRVMYDLENSGHDKQVAPLFISVDPERDTPEKVTEFLKPFHDKFVGLTGTRVALKSAADSFETLLAAMPKDPDDDYQITHSSVVYLVDPFNRIVDFIPFEAGVEAIANRVREEL